MERPQPDPNTATGQIHGEDVALEQAKHDVTVVTLHAHRLLVPWALLRTDVGGVLQLGTFRLARLDGVAVLSWKGGEGRKRGGGG